MANNNPRPRSVKMVDLSKQENIISQPTSVHCEKDGLKFCCWPKSLSSLLSSLLIPSCCCNCKLQIEPKITNSSSNSFSKDHHHQNHDSSSHKQRSAGNFNGGSGHGSSNSSSTVTGTIFGQRKGKVSMSIQEDPRDSPVMLLELAIPTFLLVKEMSSGLLRIALECEKDPSMNKPLYSEPVWTMFCNGRKAGFAVRRPISECDRAVLGMMQSISMGAGVIPLPSSINGEQENQNQQQQDQLPADELMYMRATYERVVGSQDSESFHMINPDGSPGQELSIFLLRA